MVQRIFDDLQRRVRLDVLRDPHLRGIRDVTTQLQDIVADNTTVDLFVVVVDNDCGRENNQERIRAAADGNPRIVTCCAMEEVEIWLLALHRERLGSWQEVRADCDVKEHHAMPLLAVLDQGGPGHGRKAAMRHLGQHWKGLLEVCGEVRELKDAIAAVIGAG